MTTSSYVMLLFAEGIKSLLQSSTLTAVNENTKATIAATATWRPDEILFILQK